MDVYMVVLRILHIFAGILWVGAGFFYVVVLMPSLKQTGKKAYPLFLAVSGNRVGKVLMPATALLTTVAGLLLYERVSGRFDADYMKSTQGIVLSIGVLAGLGAFGHGGAVLGRSTEKLVQKITELEAQGEAPSAAQQAEVDNMMDYLAKHANISLGLMIVAVLGMAAARYM